jgi:hypothetical protein
VVIACREHARAETGNQASDYGYNTDVEYGGVVYHVQTEDKGLQTPIILSLVYSGGAILASKRAPYDDLIASGFDQKVLVERLQRQHKLICAAINAGRINDLKRMGERTTGSLSNSPAHDVAPPDRDEDRPLPIMTKTELILRELRPPSRCHPRSNSFRQVRTPTKGCR